VRDQTSLSIVAPCYNEQDGLEEFLRRADAVCKGTGLGYEIVVVNDGSNDQTWARMREAGRRYSHLVCVNLSRNHGHQLALTAGLSVCRGERVLIVDADLQDPPELLVPMLEAMEREGAEIVYGQRRQREGETKFKLWTAAAFYRLIGRLTETPIPPDTGDFRLMSRRALDVLLRMPERHRFIRGMVSWIGFKQVAYTYDRDKRFAGETSYPVRKMVRFALDAVTSFSIKPLTWASKLGFIFAVLAGLLIVYSLAGWLSGKAAPGWTSLMAVVSLLGGVQLFFLGMLGEYVGRLYDQSKGRPLFIIESVIVGDGGSTAPVENKGAPASAGEPPVIVVRRPGAPAGAGLRGPNMNGGEE
jgi:dolichol-phosphate mannosyltransferase